MAMAIPSFIYYCVTLILQAYRFRDSLEKKATKGKEDWSLLFSEKGISLFFLGCPYYLSAQFIRAHIRLDVFFVIKGGKSIYFAFSLKFRGIKSLIASYNLIISWVDFEPFKRKFNSFFFPFSEEKIKNFDSHKRKTTWHKSR